MKIINPHTDGASEQGESPPCVCWRRGRRAVLGGHQRGTAAVRLWENSSSPPCPSLLLTRELRLAQPRGLLLLGWIWSGGYPCPEQLRPVPVSMGACVPLEQRLPSGGVQSPPRHSAVTHRFIFKGSGRYGAKMEQREGGGNEDFGLKPWPHQQDYSP